MSLTAPLSRGHRRRTTRFAALAAAISLASVGTLALTPAGAMADSTTTLTVSNDAASASGVTYTWAFTTATAGTLTQVTLTVPTGAQLSSSPAVTLYGLVGCTTGTPTLATGTITVPLTCGAATPAATPAVVSVSGITNPASATSTFTTAATTYTGTGMLDTFTGSTTTPIVSNSTAVEVYVPESLTFTNDDTSISLAPIPGDTTPAAASVGLGVSTNAAGGYTLNACVTTADQITNTTSSSDTVPQSTVTPTTLSPTGNAGFGATVAAAASATTNALGAPTIGSTWDGAKPAGYDSSCTDAATPSHSVIASDPGPATGDTITVTNQAVVPATQAGGTYTGTVTYSVTPTY